MPEQGPHLLPREIAKLCYQAGWIDAKRLAVAIAVCIAESNGYPERQNINPDGSIDRGLWMINDKAHPDVPDSVAYDAVQSTRYARKLYVSHDNSFTPWAAFNNKQYLGPRAIGYSFDAIANFLRLENGYPIP